METKRQSDADADTLDGQAPATDPSNEEKQVTYAPPQIPDGGKTAWATVREMIYYSRVSTEYLIIHRLLERTFGDYICITLSYADFTLAGSSCSALLGEIHSKFYLGGAELILHSRYANAFGVYEDYYTRVYMTNKVRLPL
jgi:hypothetical protein